MYSLYSPRKAHSNQTTVITEGLLTLQSTRSKAHKYQCCHCAGNNVFDFQIDLTRLPGQEGLTLLIPGTGAPTCPWGLGRTLSITSRSSMLNVLPGRPRRGPRLGPLLESRFHVAGQGKPRARAAARLTSRSSRFLVLPVHGGWRGGPGTHFSF